MKNRLYVLGDSFGANLFKGQYYIKDSEIGRFKDDFENRHTTKLQWWTDYIESWSNFEIINLAEPGCTNEDIFYQFRGIQEYRKGDRIIVHWTHNLRFKLPKDLYLYNANPHSIEQLKLSDPEKKLILNIFESREYHWYRENGNIIRDFIGYLSKIHQDFKPIFFSIFPENIITMEKYDYFYDISKSLTSECTINVESNGKYNDGHWGFIGNFRAALILLSLIRYDKNISEEERALICKSNPDDSMYSYKKLKIYKEYINKQPL